MLLRCPRAQTYNEKNCKPVKDAMLAGKMQKKGNYADRRISVFPRCKRSAAGKTPVSLAAQALC